MRIFYKFILFAITITSFALNANIDCGLATSEGMSIDTCTSIKINDKMRKCCHVAYSAKNGTSYAKCKIIEMTDFGMKLFKHTLANYKNIDIQCSQKYLNANVLLIMLFVFYLF